MNHYRATAIISWDFDCGGTSLLVANQKAQEMLDAVLGAPTPQHIQYSVHLSLLPRQGRIGNIQHQEFDPKAVLAKVRSDDTRVPFQVGQVTFAVKMNSQRYWLFRKNRVCAACGLVGTKMILETLPDGSNAHFNLYGDEDGELVLFTKDHVIAKAYGGSDTMDNYAVLCAPCNQLKASFDLTYEGVAELREIGKNKGNLSRKELNRAIQDRRLLLLNCLNGQ